jgi:tRNA (guanosine-2'-O-)-methyltransferase
VFPHPPDLLLGDRRYPAAEVVARLGPFLSEARRARIAEVVSGRTYTVVPVLEGVHDLGNVNAVFRSAEGLGYGGAHLAALQGKARAWAERTLGGRPRGEVLAGGLGTARRESQGADKWLDLRLWDEPAALCAHLRREGYRIVATHLSADAVPLASLDFTRRTALVLGNERDGVSEAFLAEADLNVHLPLDGFIQSYNVSVAAALALYHARQDRIARRGRHGDLSEAEREVLTAHYYVRSVRTPEAFMRREGEGEDGPLPAGGSPPPAARPTP